MTSRSFKEAAARAAMKRMGSRKSVSREWRQRHARIIEAQGKKRMKLYVASSWRNASQPQLVTTLRTWGHIVYDFRNTPHGRGGFAWSEIDPNWQSWSAEQYRAALDTPIAEAGYRSDMDAMEWADACVLVLPCGRSAHLEAGWFAGKGKPVIVLTRDGEEPELMAKMCNAICISHFELQDALDRLELRALGRRLVP